MLKKNELFDQFQKATGAKEIEPINRFFSDHDEHGFISKEDWLNYVKSLNAYEFDHVTNFFDFASKKSKIQNLIKPSMDPKTQEFVIWCHMELAKGKVRLRIPFHEGILKFIIAYQQTDIWFEGDMETLLAEAGVNLSIA